MVMPFFHSLRSVVLLSQSLLLTLIGTIINVKPASAAQTVILTYSILRESISVPELSTLAETGTASSSLQSYLNLANKRPEDLRNALNQTVEVDPVLLSQVLNSFAGDFLLDQMTEVIHTPSQRASRESLRGALVTSAISDKNIRLIEVLENYPTEEVHVNGDRLADVYLQIKGVMDKIPPLPF